MPLYRLLLIAALAAGLFACTGPNYTCKDVYPEDAILTYNIDGLTGRMAAEMCGYLCIGIENAPVDRNSPTVLVTDFIPYRGAAPDRVGQYIAESMRLMVPNKCCARAERAEFEGHLTVGPDGSIAMAVPYSAPDSLTRPATVIAGSYLATRDSVTYRVESFKPSTGEVTDIIRREYPTYCIFGQKYAMPEINFPSSSAAPDAQNPDAPNPDAGPPWLSR